MTVSETLKINQHLEAWSLDTEDSQYTKFKLLFTIFFCKEMRE